MSFWHLYILVIRHNHKIGINVPIELGGGGILLSIVGHLSIFGFCWIIPFIVWEIV